MKMRFLNSVALLLIVAVISLVTVSAKPASTEMSDNVKTPVNKVLNVVNNSSPVPEETKILQARFLNMLNHSFVYGEDFNTVQDIVNNSVLALLDMRDAENDSYIAENIVADYVFDMYGIEITDFSEINPMFEQKEGYVFILPRGYSLYSHEMVSVTENEDGSFTVVTNVTVSSHDSEDFTETCTSLIIENKASAFGYSIISSEIATETALA